MLDDNTKERGRKTELRVTREQLCGADALAGATWYRVYCAVSGYLGCDCARTRAYSARKYAED